jgi:hypothetical protein
LFQWRDFAIEISDHIDHNTYLNRAMFSNDETLYMMVMYVNSICVWEYMEDRIFPESLQWNMWCGLIHIKVSGPLFFIEQTVTSLHFISSHAGELYGSHSHLSTGWQHSTRNLQ